MAQGHVDHDLGDMRDSLCKEDAVKQLRGWEKEIKFQKEAAVTTRKENGTGDANRQGMVSFF